MADHKTDEDKQAFLDAYANCGRRTPACRAADIAYRTFTRWLTSDEEFAAAFAEAQIAFTENVIETAMIERAVNGVPKGVYHKGAMVGTELQYSDTLLLALAKANAPDKYKDRSASELSGPNGTPLEISPETSAARIAAMLEELRERKGLPAADVDPFA